MSMPPPRRIVFSRKGLDSASGGCASPIVDGRPLSLPIPAGRYDGGRPYATLAGVRASLAVELSRGRLTGATPCHLDPDIDRAALAERPRGWRGAFGQVGAAQGHLARQGVGEGDLFLFFGRFREHCPQRGWRDAGRDFHAIYGWLRVGTILSGAALAEAPHWLRSHPHTIGLWPANNTIYLAADRLDLPGAEALAGSGVFARPFRLTADGAQLSEWAVPAWLERAGMSYRPARWWHGGGRLDASGQWQEGVAPANDEAVAWAGALIHGHAA